MTGAIVAIVQVHQRVRRPVSSNTFNATTVRDDGRYLHVRGYWRNSTEQRSYAFPPSSIIAVRWLDEGAIS